MSTAFGRPTRHLSRLIALALALSPAAAGPVSAGETSRQRIELPALTRAEAMLLYAGDAAALHARPLAGAAEKAASSPRADQESTLHRWRAPSPPPLLTRAELAGDDLAVLPGRALLSPDGQRAVLQTYFGPMPVAWLLEPSGQGGQRLVRLVPEGYGRVLAWHPESKAVLYLALDLDIADPGLWLVDIADGSHRLRATPGLVAPEGLTAAAFSPDGRTLAWAKTDGMGSGGEIWLSRNGRTPRRVWQDRLTTVASLAFAPNGTHLAFTNQLDAPVPFAEAGLWTLDMRTGEARFQTRVAGGLGQEPAWSKDSQRLYFVARDNADEPAADRRAEALTSSIRALEIGSEKITVEVAAEGARHLDPTIGPGGELYFASDRSGTFEIWKVNDGALAQLSSSGTPKRHPLILPALQNHRSNGR